MASHARWSQLRKGCLALKGAEYDRKWGNVDTYLVGRKMFFIIVRDDNDQPADCWFKAGAERFLELTDLPGFRPAPYLGKRQWVATKTPQTLSVAQWQPLIEHSYRLVAATLPLYRQRELGQPPSSPSRRPRN